MKITKKLIQDIVRAEHTLQGLYVAMGDYIDFPLLKLPTAGPPATTKELSSLKAYLVKKHLMLPASYASFLMVSNGIKDFGPGSGDSLSLLSIQELMTPPRQSQLRMYPSLSRFNIARGETLEFIAFDPDTLAEGEMEVVSVSAIGEEVRHKNFTEFLFAHLKTVNLQIKYAKARKLKQSKKKI